jgi:ribosomal protein S18 acetylase RimI-like enzyme
MLSTIEKHHPREPHYYLFTIGTRRAARGLGVGSALMREVLEKCDGEQMPAYLESSNRENLTYYRRHGFEVQEELHT